MHFKKVLFKHGVILFLKVFCKVHLSFRFGIECKETHTKQNDKKKKMATFFFLELQSLFTHLSRDTRFPTMWHFDKCTLRRACAASF